MWCDRCRADAPATVSAETGRAACQTCGQDLGKIGAPSTDQARELLKRWSTASGSDAAEAASPGVAVADPPRETTADRFGPLRPPIESAAVRETSPAVSSKRTRAEKPRVQAVAGSNDDEPVVSARQERKRKSEENRPVPKVQMSAESSPGQRKRPVKRSSGSFGRFLGQFMAYLGILAITGGTALVVWGYFGGPAEYAPTGWLVATGGQMMLMLGVATLVSEGLDQSSRDLGFQIELIDHRLERIERNSVQSARRNPIGSVPAALPARVGQTSAA